MDVLDDLLGKSVDSKSTANDKKKVKFQDENDPLDNLDFSDDDSPNIFKQEQPVINSKKLSHLFGIESSKKQSDEVEAKPPVNTLNEASKEDTTLNVTDTSLEKLSQAQKSSSSSKESNLVGLSNSIVTSSNPEKPVERKSSGMKSLFLSDDEDMMANLADKPKAAASAQSKKSLMQDLFGKETTTNDASKTKSTFSSSPSVTRLNTAESYTGFTNESSSKVSSQATGYSLSASKEPRRGRRTATIQNDPFGYLSASSMQFDEITKAEEKQAAASRTTSKSPVNEALPEWLGGTKAPKEPNHHVAQTNTLPSSTSAENLKTVASQSNTSVALPKEEEKQSSLTSKLLAIEFNQQSAIINMQQQEHELRTAAALSQQSEKLNYLMETQKLKLGEQEKQFNALISRQLERQTLIEAQIKSQQQRIDDYIQTLAAQPSTVPLMSVPLSISNESKNAEDAAEKIESEGLLHKVQLEKLYLENTLESLREKHEQEISILEDSYKKQIAHLEEAMLQMEKRTQDDIESLEADYKSKIQKLKDDLSDCERSRREEKAILMEEHSNLIRDVQDRHRKALEILQKEHTEIIEKITQSKESERQAIEIMRKEGTSVQDILNKSQLLVDNLENVQKKFETKDRHFSELQENHFSNQEKNIDYLKKLLESQRAAFDEERQRFMATTQKLESNIIELTKEFQKQNANLQISQEILKSKEQALLRDREIFIEQMNWERERVKAMMDAWAKEEDKQLDWLAQERQALASERGKLQIFNRLKNQVDDSSKIEIEAAIKTAQEAAYSANEERLKWQEKIKELDRKQNVLEEEQRLLVQKAKELQEFTQSAISKREEGLKALKEAHFLEQRYKEKCSQLHSQQEFLIEKESKLAAEKLEIAKARLSLHVRDVEKPEKDTDDNFSRKEQTIDHSNVPTTTEYPTYFKDIVDPHLVILKWDLENNLGVSQTTF